MNNLVFVSLKEEYLDSLKELEDICFTSGWSRKMFENDIKNKNAFYVLCLHNQKVIAYCGLYSVLDEADITNIAVHPEYRKNGIATQLVQKIFSYCKDNLIAKVNLEVRKSNINAISLYEKNGFEIVGERKNYYSDNHEDAYLMTKHIKEVN